MSIITNYQKRIFTALAYCLFIILSGLFFNLTLATDSLSSNTYLLVNLGLFISLSCFLILPLSNGFLTNSSIALFSLLIVIVLTTNNSTQEFIFRLCLMVLCLLLLLWSLEQLFHRQTILLSVLLIITAAPVWLAPVVDLYLPGNHFINTIISLTPLTHFSIAVEYDYLRSIWFYRNTPYGSLPFSYPHFNSIISSYIILFLIVQLVLWQKTSDKLKLKPFLRRKTL